MTLRYGFALVLICLVASLFVGSLDEQQRLTANIVSFFLGVGVSATRPATIHPGAALLVFLIAYGFGLHITATII